MTQQDTGCRWHLQAVHSSQSHSLQECSCKTPINVYQYPAHNFYNKTIIWHFVLLLSLSLCKTNLYTETITMTPSYFYHYHYAKTIYSQLWCVSTSCIYIYVFLLVVVNVCHFEYNIKILASFLEVSDATCIFTCITAVKYCKATQLI